MTRSMMITMLEQGNTGAEIMQILDAITTDDSAEQTNNEPTLNTIEF